jgi:hypothetical protein
MALTEDEIAFIVEEINRRKGLLKQRLAAIEQDKQQKIIAKRPPKVKKTKVFAVAPDGTTTAPAPAAEPKRKRGRPKGKKFYTPDELRAIYGHMSMEELIAKFLKGT